jgi:putative MATE family efflux protein
VARYAQDALTAVSLSFPAQNLMIGVATGTAVGVNALLSRALGEKKPELANRIAENGVFLAMVGYAIFLIFGLFGVRAFFHAQTDVETIINYGVDYLTVICCFSFGVFGQIMFERLMQSTGRTIYTMFTQGTGAIINIILDPIFILVLKQGARGAAIATVIGQIVAFGLAATLNHFKNADIRLDMKRFRPNPNMIRRIYAIGVPSILMIAIGSVMTFLFNIILITYTRAAELSATVFGVYFKLNSFVFMPVFGLNNGVIPIVAYNYGARNRRRMMEAIRLAVIFAASYILLGFTATATAVFGIYFKLQSFVIMPVIGLNGGVIPIVAYNYGARKPERIMKTFKLAIFYAIAIMCAGLLLFQTIPELLLSLFSESEETAKTLMEVGVPALRTISFHFPVAAYCIICGAMFQALGHGVLSLINSIIRQLVVLLPAAFILSIVGGLSAIWYSFLLAEVSSLIVSTIFIRRVYKGQIKPMYAVQEGK